MRIAVITQGISNIFEFIIGSGHEVVGIVECSRESEPNSFLKTIGEFFCKCLLLIHLESFKFKNFL